MTPSLAIIDKNRFEKVISDDTILHRQDGYCSYVAEEDGDYTVMIRESSYRGGGTSYYRLHVGSFRRPDVVYPAGGKIGTKTKVRFIERDSSFEEEVQLPAEVDPDYMLFQSPRSPHPPAIPSTSSTTTTCSKPSPMTSRRRPPPPGLTDRSQRHH